MKRSLCLFLMVLMVSIVFASSPEIGYNVALVGESSGDVSFGAAEFSTSIAFTAEKHIGDVGLDVLVAFDKPIFRGVNARVSTSLCQVVSDLRFFPNAVLWEPTLTLGYQYRVDAKHRIMVGLSPFTFASTGFVYEFMSPYVTMDLNREVGWGIRVMKFTAYL